MEKTAVGIGFLSLLFLLAACGSTKTDTRASGLQAEYAELSAYRATAEVSLPRGEELLRYTLTITAEDSTSDVTVQKPENLSGIRAHLEGEELSLSYDTIVLDAGSTCEAISGVNCVARMCQAIADGYMETYARDGDALYARFRLQSGGETLQYDVRFDENLSPLSCEIGNGESVAVYIVFTAWENLSTEKT